MRPLPQPGKPTILVVDDTAANLDVARHILSERYRLQFARSGRLAVEIAENWRPDLILLDIAMPEMDGYETCTALKASPATADIPIVFVTAKTDAADESHGLSLGAVDYITKPLNPSIVYARIDNHLAIKRAHDSLSQQNEELAAANRLAERIGASLDVRAIAEIACRELCAIFDVEHASWWSLDTANREFQAMVSYTRGRQTVKIRGLAIRGDEGVVDYFSRQRGPFVMNQLNTGNAARIMNELLCLSAARESLVIPITQAENVIAVILLPAGRDFQQFRERDIVMGRTIALHVAGAIENANLYARTQQSLGAVQRDLDIGREIQGGFFPSRLPQPEGWEISAYFEPARQVAGDFYDAFTLEDRGRIGIAVADVCDKGVGAALYMVMLRSLIRSLGERLDNGEPDADVQELAVAVNRYLATTHGSTDMFATLFLGILAPDLNTLAYVNAGHHPAIVLDASGREKATLVTTGPAVGLMDGVAFKVRHIDFHPGDTLVAYTDGVIDARNGRDDPFGKAALQDLLRTPSPSALSLVNAVATAVGEFTRGAEQFDDITLLALRRQQACTARWHHMRVRAATDALPALRGFIERASKDIEVSDDAVFALKLAAEEAVANIIEHGQGADEVVELTLHREPHQVVLTMQDNGRPFDITNVEAHDLELDWADRPVGRLGLHLINQMVDHVAYGCDSRGGNRLTLAMDLGQ